MYKCVHSLKESGDWRKRTETWRPLSLSIVSCQFWSRFFFCSHHFPSSCEVSELEQATHQPANMDLYPICNQSINTENKTTLIYVGKVMHAQCLHLTFEDVAVLQFSFSWSLAQPSDQLSLNYGLCRSTLSYTQGHTSSDSYVRTYVHTHTLYIRIHMTQSMYHQACISTSYKDVYRLVRIGVLCIYISKHYAIGTCTYTHYGKFPVILQC